MKAISIRQPWAWLIVNGYKDIENRSWNTKYRGPVLIHASTRKPTEEEWRVAMKIAISHGAPLPRPSNFEYGGIVGVTTITDCVERSDSPWFFGPRGFTLADSHRVHFSPMKGKLSFFETGCDLVDIGGQLVLKVAQK